MRPEAHEVRTRCAKRVQAARTSRSRSECLGRGEQSGRRAPLSTSYQRSLETRSTTRRWSSRAGLRHQAVRQSASPRRQVRAAKLGELWASPDSPLPKTGHRRVPEGYIVLRGPRRRGGWALPELLRVTTLGCCLSRSSPRPRRPQVPRGFRRPDACRPVRVVPQPYELTG